jgi:N-acetyl-anhydromuramyl-L-alanine amidase AmpD
MRGVVKAQRMEAFHIGDSAWSGSASSIPIRFGRWLVTRAFSRTES